MPGIGKYKKGAKFTLKSGNSPLFKHMGSSPMKMYGKKSPAKADLVGNQKNLPEELKAKIKASPARKMDVLIDGKNIGTGPKARGKAIDLDIKQSKDVIKQSKKTGGAVDTKKHKKITYTGKDKEVMEDREKGGKEWWRGEQRADPKMKKFKTREAYINSRQKAAKAKKSSPAKIIPGLKKKGTKGTKFVDKAKALGKALKKSFSGDATVGQYYRGEKQKIRKKRAREEATKK